MKKIIVLLFFVLSNLIIPQQYNNFADEIFFGRLPSAKSEAMGRILTLNFDPYFVSQSNPANLASTKGVSIFYSNAYPYYSYIDATYNYFGASYNSNSIGAFALNLLSYNSGSRISSPNGPTSNFLFQEKRYLYTLTYSYKIEEWFSFGVNANLFVVDFGISKNFSDTFFEVGLSRDFTVIQNSEVKNKLLFGTQLKNIFNQSFSAIDANQSDPFPSVFRIGLSNSFEYTDNDVYEKSYLIGFTIGFEYQNLLNSGYRTTYKTGGEFSLLDIIFLRGGYYHESRRECSNCKGELEDFTYGFGFKLDFDRHFTNDFPLILLFDFVSLEQPSSITNVISQNNFTTFTIVANYRMD